MKKYLLVLFLLGYSVAGIAAQGHVAQSGEGLLKMCNRVDQVKMLGMMCHSYLNGYIDNAIYAGKPSRFCIGAGDKEQLPRAIVLWFAAHPDHLKKPAPDVLAQMLPEKFPCKR